MEDFKIEKIAKIVHQINKSYCEALGDLSQKDWECAEQWQRDSAINGVIYKLNNKDVTPEQSHENWLKVKQADSWTYGIEKCSVKKTHPCFLPYSELPTEQKAKDYIFTTATLLLAEMVDL